MKKQEIRVIKRFPTEVRLNTLLTILRATNNSNIFDLSTEAKTRKFMDRFMNEACSLKYEKLHEEYFDSQQTYKLYTCDKLWEFFTNPEVINYILNSTKFNDIKVMFNKKYVAALKDKTWKEIEYVATVDEEFEKVAKFEREYKEFENFDNFYKIKKYNSGVKPKVDYQSFVVYDGANPTDIDNIYEFPAEGGYKDGASYIRMCKYHWLRSNKYDFEKLSDAKIMMVKKYEETILGK